MVSVQVLFSFQESDEISCEKISWWTVPVSRKISPSNRDQTTQWHVLQHGECPARQSSPCTCPVLSCFWSSLSQASPGSPEEEQLGSWHAQCLAQQWHRYSSNTRCTEVGFLILQSVSCREAAEDPWQKWQGKRAVYPFFLPPAFASFYLVMCSFAKLGPPGRGLGLQTAWQWH